jgi:cbb3-type cytochrome oxidase maturation protein
MESLYILIPLSLVLVFVIGFLFWWSTQSGQFDDLKGPAYQILMDDDRPHSSQANTNIHQKIQAKDASQEEKTAPVSVPKFDEFDQKS